MNNNIDKQEIYNAIKKVTQKNGQDAEKITSALDSKDINKLLGALSPEQAKSLRVVLNNKDALNKILASERAAKIIKELSK